MSLRTLSGRAVAAVTSTVLILAVTACGEGDGEPVGGERQEGAAVEPADFADDMQAGLEVSTTAQMEMNVDAGATGTLEATGQVDYSADPVDMQISSTNPMNDEPMEIVLLDGVMYLNQGSLTNDKYLSYDLSDPEGLPPGLAELSGQLDPLAAFRELEPALRSVTFEGQDELGGEDLDHYVVVLDPAEMESFQGMPSTTSTPDDLEYDLYVDDEFRIRHLSMSMAQPAVDIEVTLSEWGEPVDIVAPPEEQVVDASQMGAMG